MLYVLGAGSSTRSDRRAANRRRSGHERESRLRCERIPMPADAGHGVLSAPSAAGSPTSTSRTGSPKNLPAVHVPLTLIMLAGHLHDATYDGNDRRSGAVEAA